MPGRLTFDSDVLIDLLRGHPEALAYFRPLKEQFLVSAMTVAELYAGVREGDERTALDDFAKELEVIPVDTEIAIRGGLFRRAYLKSHNLALPDALIAASAVARQATLVTLNRKHFPMLQDVIVPYQKP